MTTYNPEIPRCDASGLVVLDVPDLDGLVRRSSENTVRDPGVEVQGAHSLVVGTEVSRRVTQIKVRFPNSE